MPLLLSVVIPVHQGAATLRHCLSALMASDLPREQWELIIVDDACRDESIAIAAEYADSIVRLSDGPYGSAYARNRGAELARAELVAFVSADIYVEPQTLRLLAATLVSGSASAVTVVAAPVEATSLPARVHGTRLHYLECRSGGVTDAFPTSCAAVRKQAFIAAGMFDEWRTGTPRTDAREFGHRLRAKGHVIRHIANVPPVRHARTMSLRALLRAAWRDHGLFEPEGGALDAVSNVGLTAVRRAERVTIAFAWAGLAALGWGVAARDMHAVAGGSVALLGAALFDLPLLWRLVRAGPWYLAPVTLLLHLIALLLTGAGRITWNLRHHLIGEPKPAPHIEAWTEVGAAKWPPVPNRRPLAPRGKPVPPT